MIQAGNGARFAVKTLAQSGTIGNVVGENFDGDDSVEACISGAVHLAHPACANCREDFVGAHTLAGMNCQWLPPIAEVGELYNVYLSFERRRLSRSSLLKSSAWACM